MTGPDAPGGAALLAALAVGSAVALCLPVRPTLPRAPRCGPAPSRWWRPRRGEQEAAARRSRVLELCEAMRAELVAGQVAEVALARAAEDWPEVAPAARAASAGGDVPAAFRGLAALHGADALRLVGAAWHVGHRTGHGLADALGRVADDLREVERTRRVVAGELASARATARLLAALPLFALAIGAGAGSAPWLFLLGTPIGHACLVGGLALTWLGLAWPGALARGVEAG